MFWRKLNQILGLVREIDLKETLIMGDVTKLQETITKLTAAVESAVAMMKGGDDQAAIDAMEAQAAQALADLVTAMPVQEVAPPVVPPAT